MRARLFLAALLILPAVFVAVRPAGAVAVNPPIFEFRANPGDRIEDVIRVFNDDASSRLVVIPEPVNFMQKAGDEREGIPEFYPAGEVQTGRELAPWLRVETEAAAIAPLVRRNLAFALEIPEDAGPGSYFGGIILRSADRGESGVGLVVGTAVLIILRVNGDADEAASLTSFGPVSRVASHLPVRFEARVENAGNVHLQPHGIIRVTDMFGRLAGTAEMNRERRSVLPGAARRFETSWGEGAAPGANPLARQWHGFALGRYTAELELEYGSEGKTFIATTTFWVIPWLALLVLAAGLGLLIFGIRAFLAWHTKRILRRFEREG